MIFRIYNEPVSYTGNSLHIKSINLNITRTSDSIFIHFHYVGTTVFMLNTTNLVISNWQDRTPCCLTHQGCYLADVKDEILIIISPKHKCTVTAALSCSTRSAKPFYQAFYDKLAFSTHQWDSAINYSWTAEQRQQVLVGRSYKRLHMELRSNCYNSAKQYTVWRTCFLKITDASREEKISQYSQEYLQRLD